MLCLFLGRAVVFQKRLQENKDDGVFLFLTSMFVSLLLNELMYTCIVQVFGKLFKDVNVFQHVGWGKCGSWWPLFGSH